MTGRRPGVAGDDDQGVLLSEYALWSLVVVVRQCADGCPAALPLSR
ncbi:hypothetical protein ACFFHJ_26735 [Planotetraspora thailandica]|nr:hypothetical protein [Planotetraspora thailandica]